MQPVLINKKRKSCFKKCLLGTTLYILVLLFLLFIVVFVILPVIFKYSVGIQRMLIFPSYVILPKNYSNIDQFNIKGVKNFYLTVENNPENYISDDAENVTLGTWQILPYDILSELIKNEDYNYDGVLNNGKYDILIYLHGNGQDRASNIDKYEKFRKYFHIFVVDYRGYADSTKADLTESGIVSDISNFYKWLRIRTKSKIFVWGHSLGTGVGTHLLESLKKDNISANGLILEAPFTSVTDTMQTYPIMKFFSWLPWFWSTIIQPIIDHDMDFNSKEHILNVDCPIMILHAEDDPIIPFKSADELHSIAINKRNLTYQGNVIYHLFDGKEGYGHMFIYYAPDFTIYIKQFVDHCEKFEKLRKK